MFDVQLAIYLPTLIIYIYIQVNTTMNATIAHGLPMIRLFKLGCSRIAGRQIGSEYLKKVYPSVRLIINATEKRLHTLYSICYGFVYVKDGIKSSCEPCYVALLYCDKLINVYSKLDIHDLTQMIPVVG